MTKTKKGKTTTCLKDASNHQIWWLRFQILARANGFDRIITLRDGYVDAVKDEAMMARMKSAKLSKGSKGKKDTGRDGGEDFDTPNTKITMDSSESSYEDEVTKSDSSDDNSSGIESIATTSTDASGKGKSRKRTVEQKCARKNRKLYDFILSTVSDEIAMMLQRKANQDGIGALAELEDRYASSDSVRRKDLKADMNDLEPGHFVGFGDYIEAVMQIQRQLEEMGKPRDTEEVQMLIEDKAPKEFRTVIQTLAMQDGLSLENWITQLNKSTKRIGEAKAETAKGNKAGLAECPVYNDCQLCGGGGHNAKECKKFTFMKKEKTWLSNQCQ